MKRSRLLQEIAERIVRIKRSHPIRVAIDGVDAAGKTTLAEELVPLIQSHGRPVIRASIDAFHNSALIRYQRGTASPEGYYHDSFNYRALVELLLVPLGPEGTLQYCPAVFDHRTDSEIQFELKAAESNAVLLFDGIFLNRPELNKQWDFSVFIKATFEVTLARAMQRDLALFGSSEEARKRYEQRYIPGQEIYFEVCRPQERASIVIENSDPRRPIIIYGDSGHRS